jgi:protein BUR2
LFLSTKVEENTRKLRDIVNACAQKAQKNEKLQLTEDSKVREVV